MNDFVPKMELSPEDFRELKHEAERLKGIMGYVYFVRSERLNLLGTFTAALHLNYTPETV